MKIEEFVNFKKLLVKILLNLTKDEPKPNLDGYVDYKMFLYTLTTDQLMDSVDYELQKYSPEEREELESLIISSKNNNIN
tara:strand:- start:238 stop:477 length:240 start_codon:yes stop_codon:yes gene_type:complete